MEKVETISFETRFFLFAIKKKQSETDNVKYASYNYWFSRQSENKTNSQTAKTFRSKTNFQEYVFIIFKYQDDYYFFGFFSSFKSKNGKTVVYKTDLSYFSNYSSI